MELLSHTRSLSITWLDRRTLLALLLAALSGILVLTITRPPDSVPVLVAGSDIAPGTPLGELDIESRHVASADGLVKGSSVGELAAWTVSVPLAAGEPLLPSLLVPPAVASAPDSLALSLDRSHAVLGKIVPGDVVDVLVTSTPVAGGMAVTRTVATGVYVLAVENGDTGFDADRVDVLLAVDGTMASQITNARETGVIDLVRLSP
ncbi:MAG: RcpC/CpaB family pilus assembly protein [Actinomycetia bacterium]|nr:RcpC/CpaB family pilus assembly protein [Actinomycetes bacterium]